MSEDEQWGGVPRTVWFCGMHGTEPTGPANVCTCFPDEIVVQLPRLTNAQADALYEVAASRVDVTALAAANAPGWSVGVTDPAVRQGQLDDLAEAIADMLDHALHQDECWISPTATNCSCVIGRIRAALPRCDHQPPGHLTTMGCLRTVHPSTPDRHYYGGEELPGQPPTVPELLALTVPPGMIGPAADEALRELLSYCRSREEYKGRDNEIGADTAYGDVADRLSKILNGED